MYYSTITKQLKNLFPFKEYEIISYDFVHLQNIKEAYDENDDFNRQFESFKRANTLQKGESKNPFGGAFQSAAKVNEIL